MLKLTETETAHLLVEVFNVFKFQGARGAVGPCVFQGLNIVCIKCMPVCAKKHHCNQRKQLHSKCFVLSLAIRKHSYSGKNKNKKERKYIPPPHPPLPKRKRDRCVRQEREACSFSSFCHLLISLGFRASVSEIIFSVDPLPLKPETRPTLKQVSLCFHTCTHFSDVILSIDYFLLYYTESKSRNLQS